MATLVLTTVGTLVGGPVGGAIGALLGQQVDSRLFAPKGRQGPRLGDLSVQTSSYGSQIPKVFGTMRVAGTVIWATDIREDRHKQGGGKGRPKTTTYSYSASFAVALSGRKITAVGRIWADGKLLRGAAGDFKTETRYRLHPGGEAQGRDPGIAAAEGIADTPAYRGTAYAVFEDFQLGDYGNRIPSLTFEVVGDEGGTAIGTIVEEISGGAVQAEAGQALAGFAAHGDNARAVVAVLREAAPAPLYDDGTALRLGAASGAPSTIGGEFVGRGETARVAARQVPDAVSIGYYEVSRDYQAGLQRASYGAAGGSAPGACAGGKQEQVALPAAMDASAAKGLASAKLDHHWRTRERRVVTLPWRWIRVRAGHIVRLEVGELATGGIQARRWLVTGWTLEKMAVRLELAAQADNSSLVLPAVPGRAVAGDDWIHGPTTVHLFDSPGLSEGVDGAPRILAAAAGAESGWRGAMLEASSDGGTSWQAAGPTAPAAVMGTAVGVLQSGASELFDLRNSVEVELLGEDMWLESRDDDALVGGDNLAMLGSELIQFGSARNLGGRRFRLSRLLRGRRGSEWAADSHAAGEAFTLLEADTLVALPVAIARAGGTLEVAARGVGEADVPAIAAVVVGVESVRPPSPVHAVATRGPDGAVTLRWTRRSRAGWAWVDGVDAPIGEPVESYRVTISGSARVRVAEVGAPEWVYDAEAQAQDGLAPGATLTAEIVQVGALAASRPVLVGLVI